MIDDPWVAGADPLVALGGRGRGPARDTPAHEQGGREARVDESSEEAHPSETAGRMEPGPVRPTVPAGEFESVHRARDEAQVALLAGDGADLRQQVQGQAAGRRDDLGRDAGRGAQQVAFRHVRLGGHREEELAIGEPDDRLEAPEELDVVGHAWTVGSGSTSPWASARTERPLR